MQSSKPEVVKEFYVNKVRVKIFKSGVCRIIGGSETLLNWANNYLRHEGFISPEACIQAELRVGHTKDEA